MRARRTHASNGVFALRGGNEDNDLWVQRAVDVNDNPVICSVWVPTPSERRRIARGENIELIVWGEGTPPVAMTVTKVPLGKAPE